MTKDAHGVRSALVVEDRSADLRFILSVVQAAFGDIVVETARTLERARAALELKGYDLILLDLNLPDGTGASLLPFIRERDVKALVVVMTVFDDDEHLFVALQQGADGYMLKDESRADAAALLREILAGRPPLSARVARRVLKFVQSSAPGPKPKSSGPALTAREREVLALLARGHTVVSAAALLGVSEHTVKTHVKSLYRKLDVSSRAHLVRTAFDDGLV
jgi:DNA-binding NarL/FixJ family response regulator